MKAKHILMIIGAMILLAGVVFAARTTLIVFETGGDQITVRSAGEIEVESGGIIDIESGGNLKINGTNVASKLPGVLKLKIESVFAAADTEGMVGGEIWLGATGDSIYVYRSDFTIGHYSAD